MKSGESVNQVKLWFHNSPLQNSWLFNGIVSNDFSDVNITSLNFRNYGIYKRHILVQVLLITVFQFINALFRGNPFQSPSFIKMSASAIAAAASVVTVESVYRTMAT